MAQRYVRHYKSVYSKLEIRIARLAHTFSKWVKLLLNLIFHRSYEAPRGVEEIDKEIKEAEQQIVDLIKEDKQCLSGNKIVYIAILLII